MTHDWDGEILVLECGKMLYMTAGSRMEKCHMLDGSREWFRAHISDSVNVRLWRSATSFRLGW